MIAPRPKLELGVELFGKILDDECAHGRYPALKTILISTKITSKALASLPPFRDGSLDILDRQHAAAAQFDRFGQRADVGAGRKTGLDQRYRFFRQRAAVALGLKFEFGVKMIGQVFDDERRHINDLVLITIILP